MRAYPLGRLYGLEGDRESEVSVSPHWVIHVVRFAEPLTSSKARMAEAARTPYMSRNISLDDSSDTITKTIRPLTISRECLNLSVTASKGSHVHSLQATLAGGRDYMSAIMPGDWIFAWMMNDIETYIDVLLRLRQNKGRVNEFKDGLKFVGRVHSVNERLVQSPTGLRQTSTSIQGVGFGELDSSTFFDPNLARQEKYLEKVLQNLNIPLANILNQASEDASKGRGIDVNKIIPELLRAYIGEGISGPGVSAGGVNTATGAAVRTKEAPYAYVIPSEVAKILGVETPSKQDSQVFSYADILSTVLGRQKYKNNAPDTYEILLPDGVSSQDPSKRNGIRHETSERLSGDFMPTPFAFGNRSVWSILGDYSNPAINEMFTALKVGPDGRVMPTLTLRQMPYSSPPVAARYGNKVTAFHEIPRWVGHPSLISSMNVGRSDAARTNFVHLYGIPVAPTLATDMTEQLVKHPPMNDLQDYKRHGLRPHMAQYPSSPTEIVEGGPDFWMLIRSDTLMGQHLVLSGSVTMLGVVEPIAVGDNFEFMDTLYHIEAVSHSCQVRQDGTKTFHTTLSLSNGMRSDRRMATYETEMRKVSGRIDTDNAFTAITAASNVSNAVNATVEIGTEDATIVVEARRIELDRERFPALARTHDITQNYGQIELEFLTTGGNPERYLYSGVLASDDSEYDPGVTIEEDEN